jgi:SAM-dependent methyltransferase
MSSLQTVQSPMRTRFRLANHDASMEQLLAVMHRVGASSDPEEFIEIVSNTFREVQTRRYPRVETEHIRAEASFDLFRKALESARAKHGANASILILGGGEGLAGKPGAFARGAVVDVFGAEVAAKACVLDITPALLRDVSELSVSTALVPGGTHTYDLVVEHSLLHFVPNLEGFFDFVRAALKPRGGVVLGHEPNSRYWQNAECLQSLEALQRERSRTKWMSRILRPLKRVFAKRAAASQPFNLLAEVNSVLAQKHGFSAPLSENEIRRIVDVHRPEANPGNFRIGLNGLDVEAIGSEYLSDFGLTWSASAGYSGYVPEQALDAKWRRRQDALATKYPHDGTVWSAYWSRGGAR